MAMVTVILCVTVLRGTVAVLSSRGFCLRGVENKRVNLRRSTSDFFGKGVVQRFCSDDANRKTERIHGALEWLRATLLALR